MNINTNLATIGNQEVNSVNARELYEELGLNPTQYPRWIKSQTELFVENQDFIALDINVERLKGTLGGGQNKTAHLITFDMAKHICLMSKTDAGKQYRTALIEMEKSDKVKPMTRLELAKEQVRMIESLERAKDEIEQLTTELDESKEWSTIKRQEAIHNKKFNWRDLTNWHDENNIMRKEAFDQNYGSVKSYSAIAWLEVYGVQL